MIKLVILKFVYSPTIVIDTGYNIIEYSNKISYVNTKVYV